METVDRIEKIQNKFRDFFQRSPAGMYRSTLEGEFLAVNPSFARTFGYEEPSDLLSVNAVELYESPEERRGFINLLKRLECLTNYRGVGRRKDGKRVRTLENARLIKDASGEPRFIEGTLIDITDLVEAEERNSVYIRALEEAHGAILIATSEGNIQYANNAASDLYGYRPEQLVGMNFRELFSESGRNRINQSFNAILKEGRWLGEVAQLMKDGQERMIRLAMSVVLDDSGNPQVLIASARDISDLRTLEEHLRQAQKLEAIGLLASGIAHNINSPLSAIIMTAEMAQTNHPGIREFDDILQASSRIQEIISNLMTKSRKEQSREVMEIDINQLVKTELKFLEANLFFKHNVNLELDLHPNLPPTRGLYSDFSQGFQNIIQNALDAMDALADNRLWVKTSPGLNGKTAILSIRDNGCGIPEENLEKIFQPFFTTKACNGTKDSVRPSGTGLGLSTVHQMLSKYGVTIEVNSQEGEGTEFILSIPVIAGSGSKNEGND